MMTSLTAAISSASRAAAAAAAAVVAVGSYRTLKIDAVDNSNLLFFFADIITEINLMGLASNNRRDIILYKGFSRIRNSQRQ